MFCSQCGNPVPDGAQFCSNCGNPLAGQVAPAMPAAPVPPVAPAAPAAPMTEPVPQATQAWGQPIYGQPFPPAQEPSSHKGFKVCRRILGLLSLGLFLLGCILLALKVEPLLDLLQIDSLEEIFGTIFGMVPTALLMAFIISVVLQVLAVPVVTICSLRPYRGLLFFLALLYIGSGILQVVLSILTQSTINSYTSEYFGMTSSIGIGYNLVDVVIMVVLGILIILTVTGVIRTTIPVIVLTAIAICLSLYTLFQALQSTSLLSTTFGMFRGYSSYWDDYEEMRVILSAMRDVLLILAGVAMEYVTLLVIFLNQAEPSVIPGQPAGLTRPKEQPLYQ